MALPLRDRPLFICGHPKSGTSLLMALLDAHPQLVAYPEESAFFRRYLPLAQGQPRPQQLTLADRHLTHIFEWNQDSPPAHQADYPDRDYAFISAEEVRREMRRLLQERWQHTGDVLSAAVLAYGAVSGFLTPQARYWVEKTPFNERFAAQIFTWWPQARCLHMLRDPRDNYLSYRRKHPEWSVQVFARNWRRSAFQGWYNQRRFGRNRYLVLRYEELVQQPEETLRQVVGFLGLDWQDSLLQPSRAGRPWKGNSMFGQQFQGISAAPSGRWRTVLAPQETALLQRLVGRWLTYYGYPKEKTPPVREPDVYAQIMKIRVKEILSWLLKKQN